MNTKNIESEERRLIDLDIQIYEHEYKTLRELEEANLIAHNRFLKTTKPLADKAKTAQLKEDCTITREKISEGLKILEQLKTTRDEVFMSILKLHGKY